MILIYLPLVYVFTTSTSLLICLFLVYVLWHVALPISMIIFNRTVGYRLFSKRKQLKNAGQWAIITGSTDGVGKAYAELLASEGLDILLISRTEEKLKNTATMLSNKFSISTKYIAVDFTKVDIYERIKEVLDTLPSIACLINNVGMVNTDPECFAFGESMNSEGIQKFLNCNALSAAAMTHLVLPRLVAQNSGAAVINVASYSGVHVIPYISIYGATKRFMQFFSRSVEFEVRRKNVVFQTLYPMYVATSMVSKYRSCFVISPEECAEWSLNLLGVESFTPGHWIHALQIFYYGKLPQFLINDSMHGSLVRAELRRARRLHPIDKPHSQ